MSEKTTPAALPDDADMTTLTLGGNGTLGDDDAGKITVRDSMGKRTIEVDGETGYARLRGLAGHVKVGGLGEDGELSLTNSEGDSTVRLDAAASINLGGHGHYGSLYVNGADSKKRIALYGHVGEIVLFSRPRTESIRLSGEVGNIHLGGHGQDGDIFLHDKRGDTTIHLNGEEGVIHLPNGDCAEDFAVAVDAGLVPGEVVILGRKEMLERSSRAYDTRVAGVISGAGDTRPGIVLGRDRRRQDVLPVALIGKVHCKVDASLGGIEIGDLLTTSSRPGYAMKADDRERAFGAVLGKAMCPLAEGDGMIPVLVTLG